MSGRKASAAHPEKVGAVRRGNLREAASSPEGPRRRWPRLRNLTILRPDLEEGAIPATSRARDSVFRRALAVADLTAATAAFIVAILILGHDSLGVGAALAIAMVVVICKVSGLYDRDEHLLHKTTLDEAPALLRVAALYTLLAFLAGNTVVNGDLGRDQAITLWLLLFLSMIATRATARRLAGAFVTQERCIILGNVDAAGWLSTKLERCPSARAEIVGRVPLVAEDREVGPTPILGSLDSLERLLDEHRVERALVAPGQNDGGLVLLHAIRKAKRHGVRISVLPRLLEVVGAAYESDDIEGATLLGVRRHGLSRSSWLIKRSFDVVVSSLILVVAAPVMAVIAVVIKFDSRGPVLFRQHRVGRGDKVFEIFKFRTMVDGADSQRADLSHRNEAGGGLFKIESDPRITRVGRLLRSSSLDELPQLFNVLKGDMSLVGPRPLVVNEDSLIEGLHRHRLLLPPGITGLWQIFGSARIPLDEMVKIDYLYGANWSLWLDIKTLLRTVPFALSRRGL